MKTMLFSVFSILDEAVKAAAHIARLGRLAPTAAFVQTIFVNLHPPPRYSSFSIPIQV